MPQIWATYGELALVIGGSPEEVRAEAHRTGLPRRRCSDGLTRVKLPLGLGLRVLAATTETAPAAPPAAAPSAALLLGPLDERIERLQRLLSEPLGDARTTRDDVGDAGPIEGTVSEVEAVALRRSA